MSFKNVTSKNPVKALVVRALKDLTGGNKVTSVQEDSISFRANVFKSLGGRKYEALGSHVITKERLSALGVLPLSIEVPTPAEELAEGVAELEQLANEAEESSNIFG